MSTAMERRDGQGQDSTIPETIIGGAHTVLSVEC